MFSYRTLLKQAWTITWEHKYLWFLGLFASLVAGGGSWEYQVITQNLGQSPIDGSFMRLGGILAIGDVIKNFFLGLVTLAQQDFWTILSVTSIILISVILLTFFIWMAITSQGALISSVKKIITAKKKPENLTVRDSLSEGYKHFWPVLGLNIFVKGLIYLIVFLISLPLLFMVVSNSFALYVAYIIIFVAFIPVAMGLSLMIKYAIAYKVIENKSFVASLEHSFRLFRNNWLVSLEMAVILFLLNFLFSGVALIALSLILLPLFLIGLMFNAFWLTIVSLFLAIAVVIIFGSILTTFQTASWTNLFLHLKEKGGLAKLERLFSR